MLDGVFNHASRGFFQFHDILENGADSAYLDWFTVNALPAQRLRRWRSRPATRPGGACPPCRSSTPTRPAVREFLWGIGRKWIDFGIDGWRLDVANEIDDDDFWQEFRRRVRAGNPEAYIVGEVWVESTRWLNKGDMWDAVMNYLFTRACIAFFIGDDGRRGRTPPDRLYPAGPTGRRDVPPRRSSGCSGIYPRSVTSVMLNLLSSHDMARFLTLARGDLSALRLATLFQMTYPGAPSIYYGDEIGMAGGHDPLNRGAFPWHTHRHLGHATCSTNSSG